MAYYIFRKIDLNNCLYIVYRTKINNERRQRYAKLRNLPPRSQV